MGQGPCVPVRNGSAAARAFFTVNAANAPKRIMAKLQMKRPRGRLKNPV